MHSLDVHEPSSNGDRPLKRAAGFVFKKQKNRESENPSLETPHLFANRPAAAESNNADRVSAELSPLPSQEPDTPALAQAGAAIDDTNKPSHTPHNIFGVPEVQANNGTPNSSLQTSNL